TSSTPPNDLPPSVEALNPILDGFQPLQPSRAARRGCRNHPRRPITPNAEPPRPCRLTCADPGHWLACVPVSLYTRPAVPRRPFEDGRVAQRESTTLTS